MHSMLLVQMGEPTCSQRFDFEYERVFGTGEIPKNELQKMMYDDMLHFSPARDDTTTDLANRLSTSLTLTEKDADQEDRERRK